MEEEKMNGDALKIFNKLTELQTKQEERHRENKIDLKVVFRKLEKFDNLPCEVHKEKFKVYDNHLRDGIAWRIAIITIAVTVVFAGWSFSRSFGKVEAMIKQHVNNAKGLHYGARKEK